MTAAMLKDLSLDPVPELATEADWSQLLVLAPKDDTTSAVEQALLRGHGSHVSRPMAEQVAARLAGMIVLDHLKPGQRLHEAAISDAFHVSRSPVREAIRILAVDRLVEIHRRHGATVTAPDERELHDIFEVRAVLFDILFRQVLEQRPAELDAAFVLFLPRLERAARQSPAAYALAGFLFIGAVTALCGNRLLVDQLTAIAIRTLRYTRIGLSATPQAVPGSLERWRDFHSAVKSRDIDRVLDCLNERIASIRDLSVAVLKGSTRA